MNTERKIRIAILVSRIVELGPVMVIQTLVNSLIDKEELKITLFYLDKNVDDSVSMSVPVEKLDKRNFRFSDYDIIHTNGIRSDLYAFLNRKKIKYHISTLHNMVFEDLKFEYNSLISRIFGNVWLIILKRADKLVCVSETMREYYKKLLPGKQFEVIYNGIPEINNSVPSDTGILKAIDNFHSAGFKVLGCAGILTKRKGFDLVLGLVAGGNKYALVIIGEGKELEELTLLSEKLKISDRCLFCGFRSNAVNYFLHFDFFVMPSRSEGFGLALIEAVQQKVPVICSDIEVFKELFNNNEVTFFNSGALTSLSESLEIAIKEGNRKVESAFTRYLDNYTAYHMAKNYYKLYMTS